MKKLPPTNPSNHLQYCHDRETSQLYQWLYLLLYQDLNVILSLVISKISFIPKYFGDKINIKIYSSASLIDPCYLRSNGLSPLQTLHTPAAGGDLRFLPLVEPQAQLASYLAPHSRAGVLSGRQVLPHMMVVSWLALAGTTNSFILLSVFPGPKVKFKCVYFNKSYINDLCLL